MRVLGRPRSPALVLLLLRPLLASGDSASSPQARAMNPGGGARGSAADSHRLQRSTVPGSDPQRSNEVLLLAAGEGAASEPRHHVLYFPGDVQVTRAQPPRHAHAGSHTGAGAGGLGGPRKGCVVLNQLLFELKEAKKDKNIDTFIKSIRTMYWLDGGHSGGSNTWVTCPEVLKEFAQTGITVHTHVTPYQVHDPMRSWIGKEHKKFVQILGDLGMQVTSQIHFAKETPSIENHFRVHETGTARTNGGRRILY
ncbi:hypothetical protein A6R68_10853 [Neotoma lepida]|uniref:Amidohydrolase-related domain-containing protein n=1 Tax=Neotoma lepida TaxID=56216 RepID=A0A1A6FWR3_NEOLE|nr:hypothetical protein A6R68_10853 [Neotoma lepida]